MDRADTIAPEQETAYVSDEVPGPRLDDRISETWILASGGLPLSRARRRGRDGVRGGAVGHDPWSLPQSPGSLNGGTKRYTRNFCEETSVGEDGFQECHLRGLARHHRGLLA
jgi:hypothetical protein